VCTTSDEYAAGATGVNRADDLRAATHERKQRAAVRGFASAAHGGIERRRRPAPLHSSARVCTVLDESCSGCDDRARLSPFVAARLSRDSSCTSRSNPTQIRIASLSAARDSAGGPLGAELLHRVRSRALRSQARVAKTLRASARWIGVPSAPRRPRRRFQAVRNVAFS